MKTGQTHNTVKTVAKRADIAALGNRHKVEMYSGGVKVREWISTGYVENSSGSDGYFFRDEESGRRVTVSGDVVITTLAN